MARSRGRLLVALGLMLALMGMPGPQQSVPAATAQAGIFRDATQPPAADARLQGRAVLRVRYVDVNLASLDGTPRGPSAPIGRGDVLTLNLFAYHSPLFPDVTVVAVRDRVAPSSTGQGYVWSGHVRGSDASVNPVTITVENGVLIANVRARGVAYQVRHTPSGVQAIYEIDEREVPSHDHVYLAPSVVRQSAAIRAASRGEQAAPLAARPDASGSFADTGTTIDVLVAYTANARGLAGGTPAIIAEINTAIGESSTAYANSQIPQSLRLVGTMEVNFTSAGLANLLPDLQCVAGVNAQN